MTPVFDDKRAKKRIVLSTSDGKYVVKKAPKRWSPLHDFFNNHITEIVRPVSSSYKGLAIGGRVLYVVDIVLSNGETEIVPIYPRDCEIRRFKNFCLTKESLATAESLKHYLQQQVDAGNLVCRSFDVVDIAGWRAKERECYKGEPITAHYVGFLSYKVIGRVSTFLADRKLEKQNRLLAQQRSNAQKAPTKLPTKPLTGRRKRSTARAKKPSSA
jgi:hypothetical protein